MDQEEIKCSSQITSYMMMMMIKLAGIAVLLIIFFTASYPFTA